MKIAKAWSSLSIRIKALITQLVMILVPVCICLSLIVQQITTENRMDNALTTYQHINSVIRELDTSIRQTESLVNTLAGNRTVRTYVSMEPGAKREEVYQESILNLMHYAYNRYLPTSDIHIYPRTTLADLAISGEVLHNRSANRLWSFDFSTGQIAIEYAYQFSVEGGQTGVITCTLSPHMLLDVLTTIASINEQECAISHMDGRLLYASPAMDTQALIQLFREGSEGYFMLGNTTIGYCVRSEMLPFSFLSLQ